MLKHDLTIALRRAMRHCFHTSVGVAVLTLGLICFIAANLFVSYVRNYDRHWPNADRIYVVVERMRATELGATPAFDTRSDAPLEELLRVEAPELAAVARMHTTYRGISVDDRQQPLPIAYVDRQFTAIFEMTALAGDSRGSLSTPRSAVITRRVAEQLFGTVAVAGRSLTLSAQQPVDLTIQAVVEDLPEQSHLKQGGLFASGADVFVSWDVLENFEQIPTLSWGGRGVKTYALLPIDGAFTASELDRRLARIGAERIPANFQNLKIDFETRPLSAVGASTAQSTFQGFYGGRGAWVDILTALRVCAAAILAIACLNFLNLSIALGTGRAVDVSTRKVLGATTSQIVRQDMLQTGFAVLLAVAIAVAAIVPLGKLVAAPWSLAFAVPWNEPWFALLLVATIGGVTVGAGLYPALVAAGARHAAGGEVGADAMAGLRTGLVGLQFAGASALVAVAIVMLMQRNEAHRALVGRFSDQYVALALDQSTPADPDVFANELLRGPGIRGTTTTNVLFQNAPRQFSRARDDTAPRVNLSFVYTGHDYFSVMDLPVVAGRVFERDRADDALWRNYEEWAARRAVPARIVLDRAAARALGWSEPTAAVGGLTFAPGGAPNEIIGIVEDSAITVRAGGESGAAYVLAPWMSWFRIVRIAPDRAAAALAHIDEAMRSMYPARPADRLFFDQIFESAYWTFELTNRVLTGLALFALAISGTGLFGMASYMANRRTREIGIRKVQGATPAGILRLLLWDFSKPVVWANLAAWPLALIALDRYLSLFAERVAITPVPFVLALIATWLLACVAVGASAWRAAKLHPAQALRN